MLYLCFMWAWMWDWIVLRQQSGFQRASQIERATAKVRRHWIFGGKYYDYYYSICIRLHSPIRHSSYFVRLGKHSLSIEWWCAQTKSGFNFISIMPIEISYISYTAWNLHDKVRQWEYSGVQMCLDYWVVCETHVPHHINTPTVRHNASRRYCGAMINSISWWPTFFKLRRVITALSSTSPVCARCCSPFE